MDTTKKIFSKNFNRDFEVSTLLTEEGRELIRHASLVNIIFNELTPAPLVTYQMPAQSTSEHTMVYCTIADEERRITAFGESTQMSRNGNPIAEAHPGCMAHNAAFDLAAKIYLGIRNDFYTDEEIPVRETRPAPVKTAEKKAEDKPVTPVKQDIMPEPEPAPKPALEAEKADDKKAEEKKRPAAKKPAPAPAKPKAAEVDISKDDPADNAIMMEAEDADEPAAVEAAVEVTDEPAPADPTAGMSDKARELGSIPVDVGLYKDKPNNSIAEVVENDPDWIRRILSIKKPNAVVAEKVEVIRAYLQEAGITL